MARLPSNSRLVRDNFRVALRFTRVAPPGTLAAMVRLAALLACCTLLTGCPGLGVLADLSHDDQRSFEEPKNEVLGKQIAITEYRRAHWIERQPEQSIHGFKDYRGCSYAFAVDRSGVITSWKYLSEPKLCWSRVPTAFGPHGISVGG
jgi:hypothetical protein